MLFVAKQYLHPVYPSERPLHRVYLLFGDNLLHLQRTLFLCGAKEQAPAADEHFASMPVQGPGFPDYCTREVQTLCRRCFTPPEALMQPAKPRRRESLKQSGLRPTACLAYPDPRLSQSTPGIRPEILGGICLSAEGAHYAHFNKPHRGHPRPRRLLRNALRTMRQGRPPVHLSRRSRPARVHLL